MEVTALQLKVVLRILQHAGIPTCLVGEAALNYYNVARVLNDVEICVPEALLAKASSALSSTGLFELDDLPEFDLFTEYKRGFPRLKSSEWISPPFSVVVFADKFYSLDPLAENTVPQEELRREKPYSKELIDLIPEGDIPSLPMPRLPPLFRGLCRRYLEADDAPARIAVEQLIDGMDIDESWCQRNLSDAPENMVHLARTVAAGKKERLDTFSGNNVTCFIADEEEAQQVKQIPGYQ